MKKKYDLIIAKPPYGKIGADIANNIRENIDYDLFLNLLPVNDYKRVDDLYKYVKAITTVNRGCFQDAVVTVHIAEIKKELQNIFKSVEDLILDTYSNDPQFIKYFKNQNKKSYYAIDSISGAQIPRSRLFNIDTQVLLGMRYCVNGHLPYSKNVPSYKWNVERKISVDKLFNLFGTDSSNKNCIKCAVIDFNTKNEKDNFVNFIYSEDGYRFISKLFCAANQDGSDYKLLLPKVDWTQPQTVERILKEYDYSEIEILDFIKDLERFNIDWEKFKALN